MKISIIAILVVLTFSGCTNGGPSSSEIKKAFSEKHKIGLKFLGMKGPLVREIELHECKELKNDLAWVCAFTVSLENDEVFDKKGKFSRGSKGWSYLGEH